MSDDLWTEDEYRKLLATSEINDLPDSDFAYIEPGGKKDDEGKTVPRSLRHYPIHDAAHVRNALARAAAAIAGDDADAKAIAEKAMPKIQEAAKKMGIGEDNKSEDEEAESKAAEPPECPTCEGSGKIMDGHRKCPDCNGTGTESKSATLIDPDVNGFVANMAEVTEISRTRKPRATRTIEPGPEYRVLTPSAELRTGTPTDDGLVPLEGTVIVYDTPYEVNDMWGTFTETIRFGACTALLADPDLDVRFLFNHGDWPLSRSGAKANLTLTDTPAGLTIRALIDPRMTAANDLMVAMENGTITQMSVGMRVDADAWSGEDDYGMPNEREIFRLANIFDVSAVTYPASPTTSIELAQRAWAAMPVESRERTRKLFVLAKEGRQGRLSQADSDVLLHALEELHDVDTRETPPMWDADEIANEMTHRILGDRIAEMLDLLHRAAPTKEDPVVAKAIVAAHQATGAALAAQAKDPDNNTDPVDKKVWSDLNEAHVALTAALANQAKDGTPDDGPEDKDAPPDVDAGQEGDEGGDQGGSVPDNLDGTGSRARQVEVDTALARLRRPLSV